ncbi:MAG: glycosyltransferase family 1 protein [Calditrichaeota bacterium]|nr:MAG: glycosyltransferase family 1 protein [Calditrichota bacterium]
MKRVAIDVRMLHHSGIGRYIQDVVPGVMERAKDVEFYFLGSKTVLQDLPWCQTAHAKILAVDSPIYSLAEQLVLKKILPRDVDLFWSPHYNIPVFYRGTLLVTVHDVFHLAMQDVLPLHQKIYSRLMFSALKRKADAIISVSRFSKGELIRFADVTASTINVVHNGLNSFWFSQDSGSSPRAHPYLLYVGNVKPHKNIKRLLQAYKYIASECNHDLVIIGKKSGFITGESGLEQEYSGLEERVHFTGFISDAQLRNYYKHADLFVFPSTYEGFGFPPLEAMASGTAVLAARIGAVEEVCGDAVTYCDPYDVNDIATKMRYLLEENDQRYRMATAGQMRAEKYTQAKSVEETYAVLEKVLSTSG